MKKTLLGVAFAAMLSLVTVAPAAANIVWATLAPIACEVDTERLYYDHDYLWAVAGAFGQADAQADWYILINNYAPSAVEYLAETAVDEVGC